MLKCFIKFLNFFPKYSIDLIIYIWYQWLFVFKCFIIYVCKINFLSDEHPLIKNKNHRWVKHSIAFFYSEVFLVFNGTQHWIINGFHWKLLNEFFGHVVCFNSNKKFKFNYWFSVTMQIHWVPRTSRAFYLMVVRSKFGLKWKVRNGAYK